MILKKGGFTLVEMMIVVIIVGILAAIAIPSFRRAKAQSLLNQKARAGLGQTESKQSMEEKLRLVVFVEPDAYYFPFASMGEFLHVRTAFLNMHPNLESVCVEPDISKMSWGDSSYGATVGHTMYVREKR